MANIPAAPENVQGQTNQKAEDEPANVIVEVITEKEVEKAQQEYEFDKEKDEQYKLEYEQLVESEKTHLRWKQTAINVSVLVVLTLANVLKGSRAGPSIAGIQACSAGYWLFLCTFLVYAMCITAYSVKQLQHEQFLKIRYGNGLVKSDIPMEGKNLVKLMTFSLVGGWVSGAFGLGGGAIFNPLLLSFGVPPKVASATGMYMIIFATTATTVQYSINKMVVFSYGLWMSLWCILGTVAGMKLLDKLMEKYKRQSPLVFLLLSIFVLSTLGVLYFGIIAMDYQAENIYEWGSICKVK